MGIDNKRIEQLRQWCELGAELDTNPKAMREQFADLARVCAAFLTLANAASHISEATARAASNELLRDWMIIDTSHD